MYIDVLKKQFEDHKMQDLLRTHLTNMMNYKIVQMWMVTKSLMALNIDLAEIVFTRVTRGYLLAFKDRSHHGVHCKTVKHCYLQFLKVIINLSTIPIPKEIGKQLSLPIKWSASNPQNEDSLIKYIHSIIYKYEVENGVKLGKDFYDNLLITRGSDGN